MYCSPSLCTYVYQEEQKKNMSAIRQRKTGDQIFTFADIEDIDLDRPGNFTRQVQRAAFTSDASRNRDIVAPYTISLDGRRPPTQTATERAQEASIQRQATIRMLIEVTLQICLLIVMALLVFFLIWVGSHAYTTANRVVQKTRVEHDQACDAMRTCLKLTEDERTNMNFNCPQAKSNCESVPDEHLIWYSVFQDSILHGFNVCGSSIYHDPAVDHAHDTRLREMLCDALVQSPTKLIQILCLIAASFVCALFIVLLYSRMTRPTRPACEL